MALQSEQFRWNSAMPVLVKSSDDGAGVLGAVDGVVGAGVAAGVVGMLVYWPPAAMFIPATTVLATVCPSAVGRLNVSLMPKTVVPSASNTIHRNNPWP